MFFSTEIKKNNGREFDGIMSSRSLSSAGFTLIELLVVLAIMALLLSSVIVNIAGQRIPRNMAIGENELVTNIRKVQSYSLSSRSIGLPSPAEYYIIKFDANNPTHYFIQAIYNVNNPPAQVQTMETINLPTGIRFAASNPVTINGSVITTGCAVIAFQLPYSKVIVNDGCNLPSNPSITSSPPDDYQKIISFVTNGISGPKTDAPVVFTLTDANATMSKQVTLSGITGLVTFQ